MAKTSKPSLAETHPGLAAQADGWDPNFIKPIVELTGILLWDWRDVERWARATDRL